MKRAYNFDPLYLLDQTDEIGTAQMYSSIALISLQKSGISTGFETTFALWKSARRKTEMDTSHSSIDM